MKEKKVKTDKTKGIINRRSNCFGQYDGERVCCFVCPDSSECHEKIQKKEEMIKRRKRNIQKSKKIKIDKIKELCHDAIYWMTSNYRHKMDVGSFLQDAKELGVIRKDEI